MAEKPPEYSVHAIHLVRTAVQSHLTLSQMADQKANILLAATMVVFTISVGQAGSGRFAPALMTLALFALLAAICAILAVLPAVHHPKPLQGDANLLFFGAFSDLGEDEFCARLLPRLTSDDSVFRVDAARSPPERARASSARNTCGWAAHTGCSWPDWCWPASPHW